MNKLSTYCVFAALTILSCKRMPLFTSANSEDTEVLQRKIKVNSAVIFGHIDEIYLDGSHHPVMMATVSANNQGKNSNEFGNYSLDAKPGRYNISVRCVGYQPVVMRSIKISKNNYVKIDFHLIADVLKL